MRIFIINHDYSAFTESLYERNPGLSESSYAAQLGARYQSLFGAADFYSSSFRGIGHEVMEVFANNEWLQKTWAREQGVSLSPFPKSRSRPVLALQRFLNRKTGKGPGTGLPGWYRKVLTAQVEAFQPDVIYNQEVSGVPIDLLDIFRRHASFIVGQHAATPLRPEWVAGHYDAIVSSFEPTLEFVDALGVKTFYNKLAFGPLSIARPAEAPRSLPLTFVGSLGWAHTSRLDWLEKIAQAFPDLQIFTPDAGNVPDKSPIRPNLQPPVFGRDMYEVLGNSKITLNHHGDVLDFANNFRLYEATGMGAALITDYKTNLSNLFEIGTEVMAYRTVEECTAQIRTLISDDCRRQSVGECGRARTLREHTFANRASELAVFFNTL